ncbi:hypothetical protein [Arthrobacter sp. NPDC056727]|uniref:hypothetical protein n=1 Tax=Arthrobacter sp. NPDC056727 TaxID=3345927 RepID=UPI00366D238B
MLTLQRRHLVGHDILLARHGNHISAMRVDRSADRVIALLDDGSVDSAPNLISPDLRLPDTLKSVIREDWKFLALVSTGIAAVCGIMLAGAVSMAGMSSDPAMAQLLANTYAAY